MFMMTSNETCAKLYVAECTSYSFHTVRKLLVKITTQTRLTNNKDKQSINRMTDDRSRTDNGMTTLQLENMTKP